MDDHPSRPSSRGGDDNHLHPHPHPHPLRLSGSREFLRSISNPPPRSSERGTRQLESKIGTVQESEKSRLREGSRVGAVSRIEECSTKFSDTSSKILAVSGRKETPYIPDSDSLKHAEAVSQCDKSSSSRTHTRTDISTDRNADSGLKERLSIEDPHTVYSSSIDVDSPYTIAVNRFLDRNSRASPMENILQSEESRKVIPQDSLPAMENIPLKKISRKTRDAIIVSVIKSLDVGNNTDLSGVSSTDNRDNQISNSNKQNNNQNIDRSLSVENDFHISEKSLRSISEKIKRNINENFGKNNSYRRK
jgi:hypothetical protein